MISRIRKLIRRIKCGWNKHPYPQKYTTHHKFMTCSNCKATRINMDELRKDMYKRKAEKKRKRVKDKEP